jgi:hypothetical protein
METTACPHWCVGSHHAKIEHYSSPTRVGDLLAELVQPPDEDQVYLSLLKRWDGTERFLVPMSVVPLIATTALRLTRARRHGIVT